MSQSVMVRVRNGGTTRGRRRSRLGGDRPGPKSSVRIRSVCFLGRAPELRPDRSWSSSPGRSPGMPREPRSAKAASPLRSSSATSTSAPPWPRSAAPSATWRNYRPRRRPAPDKMPLFLEGRPGGRGGGGGPGTAGHAAGRRGTGRPRAPGGGRGHRDPRLNRCSPPWTCTSPLGYMR